MFNTFLRVKSILNSSKCKIEINFLPNEFEFKVLMPRPQLLLVFISNCRGSSTFYIRKVQPKPHKP